jgi:hypothetical protein
MIDPQTLSPWWLALPVLILPILWHRQKREQTKAAPLASARFLPMAEPKQLRVWLWRDPLLLLLRCLMLLTLIALLADPVLPWRGDSVLVMPGTKPAAVESLARAAGFTGTQRIALPGVDAIAWLHAHEREFKPTARLLVLGAVPMPAAPPRFRHAVQWRADDAPPAAPTEHHVAVFSHGADAWRRMFAAASPAWRIVVDAQPGPRTELLVWDLPEAPPAGLRAPLWWAADARLFPELAHATQVDGLRVAAGARGRVWAPMQALTQSQAQPQDVWPPHEPQAARALFAAWQRLQLGPQAWPMPLPATAADAAAPPGPASGALRKLLAAVLVLLFVLERMLTHARRR